MKTNKNVLNVEARVLSLLITNDPRSVEQIAELVGLDQSIVSRLKRGRREPTQDQIDKFAKFYGVEPELLKQGIPLEMVFEALNKLAIQLRKTKRK